MSLLTTASQTERGSYGIVVVSVKAQQLPHEGLWLLTLKAVMYTIDHAFQQTICLHLHSLMPKPRCCLVMLCHGSKM